MKEGLMEEQKQALEKEIEREILEKCYVPPEHGSTAFVKASDAAAAIARLVQAEITDWQQEVLSLNHVGLELEKQLVDKEMTIGVLEAAIETWKDIVAGHLAKIAQMREGLEYIEQLSTIIGPITEPRSTLVTIRNVAKKALKALSPAPRVVPSAEGQINHLKQKLAGCQGELHACKDINRLLNDRIEALEAKVVWSGKGYLRQLEHVWRGEQTWIPLSDERGFAEFKAEGFHGEHHRLAAVTVTLDEGGEDG